MCLCVHGLCAELCMSYLRCLGCVKSGVEFVSCAGCSLCYVQLAATNLVASLLARVASLSKEGTNKGSIAGPNNGR